MQGLQALSPRRWPPLGAFITLPALRVVHDWAERKHLRLKGTNPAQGIARNPERKRERYLSPDELQRLGAALAAAEAERTERREAVALIRLLLLTGTRLREILTLRWEWIDWTRHVVRLPESKSGAKNLYLCAPALEVLRGLGPQGAGLVLPGITPGQPMAHPFRVWRRLCRRARLVELLSRNRGGPSPGASRGVEDGAVCGGGCRAATDPCLPRGRIDHAPRERRRLAPVQRGQPRRDTAEVGARTGGVE